MAPFNSWIKNHLGAKNAMLVGLVITTGCTAGLGAMSYIQDDQIFYLAALSIRFLQGIGDCIL
jgi:hypothetical protein